MFENPRRGWHATRQSCVLAWGWMIAQRAAFHNTQFNILVAVTRRVNFLEACSLSREISTCDKTTAAKLRVVW